MRTLVFWKKKYIFVIQAIWMLEIKKTKQEPHMF